MSGDLLAFRRLPGERARPQAGRSLMETGVDQSVRYVSPVLSLCRTVTEDHDLCGRPLQEGDKVLMLYQSANQDEAVSDADGFRKALTEVVTVDQPLPGDEPLAAFVAFLSAAAMANPILLGR